MDIKKVMSFLVAATAASLTIAAVTSGGGKTLDRPGFDGVGR
jgi:hypothetical protein